MIDAALRASLAVFDDAALATLANPGLVRRAHRDLAEGRLRLVSTDGSRAEVAADGQIVRIDARGPKAADCACKAITVCRHRIAAVIFLQTLPLAADEAETTAPVPAEPAPDPVAILAALDPVALQRWAGKASWRAALELVANAGAITATATALSIRFAGEDDPVRILRGQGFDGIVSKIAKSRCKAVHAAAVLAARRHFGLGVPEHPAGPDAHDDDNAPDCAVPIDGPFLDRVVAILCDTAALGFNLAPVPLEEALFELSVSSRADSLPRLAAILRGVAAQIRLRRQRSVAFDPDRMMELAATGFALTAALRGAEANRLIGLAGKVRRDFSPAPPLTLIGCGGERWTTATGARGVTAWFLDPASGQWLSTTLARGPGQDPNFVPGDAWHTQTLWQAAPLSRLAHARIALTGANLSADGRLSAPAGARAVIVEKAAAPQANDRNAIRDWRDLRAAFLRQAGLGLDAGGVSAPVGLLCPTQVAAFQFDDLAQQLVWPIRDENGRWLALTLDHDERSGATIAALEASVHTGWQGMILAKIRREGDRLAVSPLTLFGAGDPVDLSLWRRTARLHDRKVRDTFDWWRVRAAKRALSNMPRGASDGAIAAAWRALIDCAEAGPGMARTLQAGLAAHADRLETHGLPTLGRVLRASDQPAGILRAAYALLIARQQRCEAPLMH